VRYEERRAARSGTRAYAPPWSDGTAAATMAALERGAAAAGTGLEVFARHVLMADSPDAELRPHLGGGLGSAERTGIAAVLAHHGCAVKAGAGSVKAFMKPLYKRRAAARHVELVLERIEPQYPRLEMLLACKPSEERLRDIAQNNRVVEGLAQWPLGMMEQRGVICYECAYGRLMQERGGRLDASFMAGLVHTDDLPTAVGNAADHYVLVGGGEPLRWLSVEENARALEVPPFSPLMVGLGSNCLTAIQAVSALGRGIHVGAARSVLRPLVTRGTLRAGMTYGSAWSGIDTFAAAVEAETGGEWRYAFASESGKRLRRALVASWGGRGLTAARCHEDARGIMAGLIGGTAAARVRQKTVEISRGPLLLGA
jgi:hypothetical protein